MSRYELDIADKELGTGAALDAMFTMLTSTLYDWEELDFPRRRGTRAAKVNAYIGFVSTLKAQARHVGEQLLDHGYDFGTSYVYVTDPDEGYCKLKFGVFDDDDDPQFGIRAVVNEFRTLTKEAG